MSLLSKIHHWSDESAIRNSGARYAGFWRRFLSAFIDTLVFIPLYMITLFIMSPELADWVITAIMLLIFAWCFSSRKQATPGMRFANIYVVNTKNEPVHFWQGLVWGITSAFGLTMCCVAILYLQSRVDFALLQQLLLEHPEVIINAQQGIEDPQLTAALGGFTLDEYVVFAYGALGLTLALFVLWALAIAIPRNKAGFHNWLCKTRFVVGRIG